MALLLLNFGHSLMQFIFGGIQIESLHLIFHLIFLFSVLDPTVPHQHSPYTIYATFPDNLPEEKLARLEQSNKSSHKRPGFNFSNLLPRRYLQDDSNLIWDYEYHKNPLFLYLLKINSKRSMRHPTHTFE